MGNDFKIGELSGPGIDVELGGVDLIASGIGIENFPGAVSMEIDTSGKGGTTRTGQSKLGWTMGAYEYDTNALPTEIYVATDGSDGHPLGTESAPFASLARAYTAARVDSLYQPRWEVSDIKVKAGEYESTEPIIITNTGKGLTITGVDDNTVKATLKNEKTETVIVFQGQSQSSGNPPSSSNPTVFSNFAVTSSLPPTAASGIGIHIRDGSNVYIEGCIIDVNGPLTTYGIKVNGGSHLTIEDSEINLNRNAVSYGITRESSSTLTNTNNKITANTDIQTN